MNRARRRNTIVLAGFSVFLIFFILGGGRIDIPCPFKSVTSIPCPGCGGMRAAGSLFHGDIAGAIATNPLSVLVIVFIAVSAVWLAIDIIRGRDSYWQIFSVRWSRTAIVVAIALILANWAWNIFKGL